MIETCFSTYVPGEEIHVSSEALRAHGASAPEVAVPSHLGVALKPAVSRAAHIPRDQGTKGPLVEIFQRSDGQSLATRMNTCSSST